MTHGQNKIPAHPGLRQLELLSLPAGAGSPPGAQSCQFPGTWDWDGDSGYVLKMQFLRAWKQMSSQVLCLSGFFLLEKSVPQGKGLWAVAVFTAGAALQWAWPLLYAKTFLWCRIVWEWRQMKGLRVLLDEVWMIKLCWRSCSCIIEHKLQLVWFCP